MLTAISKTYIRGGRFKVEIECPKCKQKFPWKASTEIERQRRIQSIEDYAVCCPNCKTMLRIRIKEKN